MLDNSTSTCAVSFSYCLVWNANFYRLDAPEIEVVCPIFALLVLKGASQCVCCGNDSGTPNDMTFANRSRISSIQPWNVKIKMHYIFDRNLYQLHQHCQDWKKYWQVTIYIVSKAHLESISNNENIKTLVIVTI